MNDIRQRVQAVEATMQSQALLAQSRNEYTEER